MLSTILAIFLFILTAGLVVLSQSFRPSVRGLALAISGVTLVCVLVDAVQLVALPILGLSFGPVARSLATLNAVRLAFLVAGLLTVLALHKSISWARLFMLVTITIQVVLLPLEFDAMFIEPFRLTVTEEHLDAPAFLGDRPLSILQLSDLHVERITSREEMMLEKVNALQPDIIVLTGDYVNVDYLQDPAAQEAARQVISQLSAPYGVYAISGSTDPGYVMSAVFEGLDNVQVLDNEVAVISLPGGTLYLQGVSINGDVNLDREMLTSRRAEYPADAYFVLLYHSPDLIDSAAELGIPLYFAGHTHGGQVRLPLFGAVVTFSDYGKQYEMGRYQVGGTTLYVTRGLGMEGLGMPRVRFLCPPEIVLFELGE